MRIRLEVMFIGFSPFQARQALPTEASIEAGQFTNLGSRERPGELLTGILVAHHGNLVAVALDQIQIVVDIDDLYLVGQAADRDQLVGLLAELTGLTGIEQQSHRIPSGS